MPNTILTHQIIAREAAAILSEESPFIANVNKGYSDEFGRSYNGAKPGQTITIRVPPVPRVNNGRELPATVDDHIERSVSLTLLEQQNIPIAFTAREKALQLTDFRERVLRPAMSTLASWVEADLIRRAYRFVPSVVGTVGTVPNNMKVYAQARERLQNYLAPPVDRSMLISSAANVELVDASRALFNPVKQIERSFLRGTIGEAMGATFYEHQSIPLHTNGNQASWTVNGANQTGSQLNVGGLTNGQTITAGTVFTIAGVNAVHPLTGADLGRLQQFVVTEDFTAGGTTGTIRISPAITPAAPNRTVTASPANSATCTMVGGASASYANMLMFQQNAFAVAFVPLPVHGNLEGYTATLPNGVSVRVMTFSDGAKDLEVTRVDVLYGITAVNPLHAVRIVY